MPPPINTSALTAIALSPPETVHQDVNDAGTTHTVWYKYTAQPGDDVVGLFAYGDDLDYFVRARVYTGPAAAPVAYLGFNTAPLTFDTPFQVPVNTPGETFYFEFFSASGDVAAAPLTLTIAIASDLPAAVGDLYINDEDEGYPLAILDPTTAAPKQFVVGFANGEAGAFLPSGLIALEDTDDNTVVVYNGIAEVATVSFPHAPAAFISIGSNRTNTFYLGNRGSGATVAFVRALSTTGVLGTTWTLPTSGLYGMAVALDDSILYWGASTAGSALQRYDLVGNAPLANLAAGIALYGIAQDMFVLADGSILVGYARSNTANPSFMVKRYDAAGAVLNTYNFNFASTTTVRLAVGLDDPLSFWVKRHTAGGGVTFYHILVADGSTLATLSSFEYKNGKSQHTYPLTETTHFGNAASCPFWIGVAAAPTGAIRVEKIVTPASVVLFDFLAGGGLSPTTFQLGHGDLQEFLALAVGAGYTITEVPDALYTTVYQVSNGSPIDNLLVVEGETTVVVVTNTRLATVCPPQDWLQPTNPGCVAIGELPDNSD